MTDLLGPASAPNAVTARLAEYRAFGAIDTWFRPCSTPAAQDGTQIQAAWLNGITAQLRGAIRSNGLLASGTGPVVPEVNTTDTLLAAAIQLLIARGQPNAGTDTGTSDALVVAPATPWPEYVKGARIWVVKSVAAGPNASAAPSLAVSGLAPVTIVRRDGSALLPGDLPAGIAFCAQYDGTYFRLVSLSWGEIAAAVQSGKWVYGVDHGVVNAAVVTLYPVQAPVDGQEILVKWSTVNTAAAPTINVSGYGTRTVVRQGGGAIAAGDLVGYVALIWDATNTVWRVNGLVMSDINPAPITYVAGGTAQNGQVYFLDLGVQQSFTLPNPATIPPGWRCKLQVVGSPSGFQTASAVVAAGAGSTAISYCGASYTTFYLAGGGESIWFFYNGTNFYASVDGIGINYGIYRSNTGGATQPGSGGLSQLVLGTQGGNTAQFSTSAATITFPFSGLWSIEAKLSAVSASSTPYPATLYLSSDNVLTQVYDSITNSTTNASNINLSLYYVNFFKSGQTFCATSLIPSGMNWVTSGNVQNATLLRR